MKSEQPIQNNSANIESDTEQRNFDLLLIDSISRLEKAFLRKGKNKSSKNTSFQATFGMSYDELLKLLGSCVMQE